MEQTSVCEMRQCESRTEWKKCIFALLKWSCSAWTASKIQEADFALQEDPFCTKSKILAKGGVARRAKPEVRRVRSFSESQNSLNKEFEAECQKAKLQQNPRELNVFSACQIKDLFIHSAYASFITAAINSYAQCSTHWASLWLTLYFLACAWYIALCAATP